MCVCVIERDTCVCVCEFVCVCWVASILERNKEADKVTKLFPVSIIRLENFPTHMKEVDNR